MNLRKKTTFQTNFDNTYIERSRTSSLITAPPSLLPTYCQGLKDINKYAMYSEVISLRDQEFRAIEVRAIECHLQVHLLCIHSTN